MRIVHIFTLGIKGRTGISEVVVNLSAYQRELSHEVRLLCLSPNFHDYYDAPCDVILRDKDFRCFIESFTPQIVIFHSLYKWHYIQWSNYLRKQGIPYLIEMHGASSVENQRKSWFQKKIANVIVFNRIIKQSSAIIYLNEAEQRRSLFAKLSNNVIIPNGVTMPANFTATKTVNNPIKIIFLGRIDIFHKGLDYLLQALEKIQRRLLGKAEVHFYGYTYDDKFQTLLTPLHDIAQYHGAIFGKDKEDVLHNGDIFIHTSRYEGMPMAIIEALSYGIPCIVTPQTNMSELITQHHAGWVTALDSSEIAKTILQAIREYQEHTEELRKTAHNAVASYSWPLIAKRSIETYMQCISPNSN